MTAPSVPCEDVSLDFLSAYLDRELQTSEEADLELHLAGCDRCQQHLEGLRSVVGGLRSMDRLQAPSFIEESLRYEISIQAQRRSALGKRLDRLVRPRSMTGPLFAMVLALSVIVVMYSIGLEQASQPATEVIVPPPGFPLLEVGGRSFSLTEPEPLAGPQVEDQAGPVSAQWVERGAPVPASRRLEFDSDEAQVILAELPELVDVLEQGRDVVLVWQGESVCLIRYEP